MNPFVSPDVSGQSFDHTLSLQNEFDTSEPKIPNEKSDRDPCKITKVQSSQSSPPKVPKKSKKVISKQKDSNSKLVSARTETSKMFKCPHCDAVYAKAVQLGGHQSKKHPGASNAYSKKL